MRVRARARARVRVRVRVRARVRARVRGRARGRGRARVRGREAHLGRVPVAEEVAAQHARMALDELPVLAGVRGRPVGPATVGLEGGRDVPVDLHLEALRLGRTHLG